MTIAEKEWIRECWSKALRDLELSIKANNITEEILDTMNRWKKLVFCDYNGNDDTERLIRESGIIV